MSLLKNTLNASHCITDHWPRLKAALDFKYLSDRYQKGRAAIEKYMQEKHQVLCVQSLVLAHAPIVQTLATMGQGSFLGFTI